MFKSQIIIIFQQKKIPAKQEKIPANQEKIPVHWQEKPEILGVSFSTLIIFDFIDIKTSSKQHKIRCYRSNILQK